MTRHLFGVAVLLVATLAVAAPVPKVKPPAYPVEVGTKWEYIRHGDQKQVLTQEITESEEKDGLRVVTMDMSDSGRNKYVSKLQVENGEVRCCESAGSKYDPAPLLWKPGLKEGDSWTDRHQYAGLEFEVVVTVGQAEEITTPAGKFTAVPLVHKYNKPADVVGKVTWYADGVGMVRQTVDGFKEPSQELKAFTPAAAKK